jgi:ABC-type transport system involved in multi-copper enzyme maturation permease subunit
MLWHMTKREIYDHFTSLRFALTVGLITLLMALNALIFVSSDYKQRLAEYSQNIAWVSDKVKENCQRLNTLAEQGPISFYRRPSPLAFCANDQEDALPIRIHAKSFVSSQIRSSRYPENTYRYRLPWWLQYVQDTYQKNSILKTSTALDWNFIIGVVMSFVAILFTFDTISGERERGTLALTMSNATPRGVILLAKFLGAFIAIAIPMLMGMLLSLLIVMLSGIASFSGNDWARIGWIVVLSFIYLSLFLGLGLAISSQMAHSSTSLLVLLLIWVVFVVIVPNTLGSVVSTLHEAPSQREFQQQRYAMRTALKKSGDELLKFGSPKQPNPDIKAIELIANYITTRVETETRLADEHLDAQFAQVQFARKVLRTSPATIYKYAMETLAGTGFERHRQFVDATRRYRSQFIKFIKSTDRADPDSFHVYYIREGLSSKPVSFGSVPRFTEPTGVGVATKNVLMDLSLLMLFSVLLFLVSYVAFLRCDVQ